MSFTETRYLLSERSNPNSAVRSNGVRFWGYPERSGGLKAITCIVVHTTENDPGPGVALNVAKWQAFTAPAPSSYHALVDTRDVVRTLEDRAVAFHAVGMNTRGLGLSFATRAHLWGRNASADQAMLERGAWVAARWAERYSIPLRWLTKAQAERGVRGFIRHSVADPSRRFDPGGGFPAGEFFRLVSKTEAPPITKEPDVDTVAQWAEAAWKKLTRWGVVDGTRPGAAVTRQELAVILERLGMLDSGPEVPEYALEALQEAVEAGWVKEGTGGSPVRRYDLLTILRRAR